MKTKNPIWANSEQTLINCEIEHPVYGWIPFTAALDDVELHGREIFVQLAVGIVAAYVPPPAPTSEQLATAARSERDRLLAATDWTQAGDIPQATKDLWTPYRQSLRDIPAQVGFPVDIGWPTKP